MMDNHKADNREIGFGIFDHFGPNDTDRGEREYSTEEDSGVGNNVCVV